MPPKSKKVSKKKVESSEEEDVSDDYSEESDYGLNKKSKKIQKKEKKKPAKTSKDSKSKKDKKQDKKASKTKGKSKKVSDDDDDSGSDSDNALLKQKKKIQQKKDSGVKGYTKSQLEQYKELLVELSEWKNNELKTLLQKNGQSGSGNKKELVAKVADGKVLGKIPRCPRCAGGRPKFDYVAGTYKCPGFRDDEDFRFCNKKYTLEELPREEWED